MKLREIKLFIYLFITTKNNNAEALVVASKETGLEVNAEKTNYMVMTRDQNAGRSHSIKNNNSSFERLEQFKYLETALIYKNPVQEEMKSRLNSGNTC
jgi:hypothetical protein